MATLLNKIQVLDDTDPFLTRDAQTSDLLQSTSEWEFQSDVTINANLTVNGTLTAIDSQTTLVADPHLYLNNGYTSTTARTGGLVVNYLPTATSDTPNGAISAGIGGGAQPTIATTGSATFAVGDFIQLSGFTDPENNGLFEVLDHVGTALRLRGVGTTATQEDFTQTQLKTNANETTGAITKVNVSILRSGTDGAWETALGSSSPNGSPLVFTDLGAGASTTLDQAYQNGNTINTSIGDGDVVISGTEQLLITATGGLNIDTQFDFDGTVFDVLMTGSNGFSIDGTANSNVTVDQGNLTLNTTNSGDVVISAASIVNVDGVQVQVDGTDDSNFSVTANSATNKTLTLAATNAGAGQGNVSISADDVVSISSGSISAAATGAFTATAGAASSITVTGADLTLATVTSGNVLLDSAQAVGVTSDNGEASAAVTITTTGANGDGTALYVGQSDPSGGAGISAPVSALFFRDSGGTGTVGELYLKTGAADTAWTELLQTSALSLQGAYDGGNTIVTSGGNALDVSGTEAISLDATGNSNFSVSGGTLALETVTSGNVDINSAGDILADAVGAISLDAVTASNFTVAASGPGQDLTIAQTGNNDSSLVLSSTGTGSDALRITATAGGMIVTSVDNTVDSYVLTDGGGQQYLAIDSTNGAEKLGLKADMIVDTGVGIGVELVTTDGLAQGDIVRIDSSGQWNLADADSTFLDSVVMGVSLSTATATDPARCNTVHGMVVGVRFGAAPAAVDNGRPVFLSATPGVATLTPPTGAGTTRYMVGILVGADGANTTPTVLWAPQYISRTP